MDRLKGPRVSVPISPLYVKLGTIAMGLAYQYLYKADVSYTQNLTQKLPDIDFLPRFAFFFCVVSCWQVF